MDNDKQHALAFLDERIKTSEHTPTERATEIARGIILASSIVPGVSLMEFRDGAICLQWAEQGLSIVVDDDVELYGASNSLAIPDVETLSHDVTEIITRLEPLLQTNKLPINWF